MGKKCNFNVFYVFLLSTSVSIICRNPTPEETELLPVNWPPINYKNPQALVLDQTLKLQPLWPTESLNYLRDLYAKFQRIDVEFNPWQFHNIST